MPVYRSTSWHVSALAGFQYLFLVENWRAAPIKFPELVFEPAHVDELAVPPAFDFARDEAIVRIHGIILPACVRGFKTCPL